MLEKYAKTRAQILEAVNQTIEIAQERKLKTVANFLSQNVSSKLQKNEFYMVVLGEFNVGKSLLVNSLLQKDILPTSVRPTTATLNILKYGETPSATAITFAGESEEIPIGKLSEYVAVGGERTENIAQVDISYPLSLLEDGVIIVDTPGVNDLNLQRTEITSSYLPKADVALFLIDCKQPVSDSQLIFLRDKVLQSTIQKIFFVVNKVDQISSEEGDEVVAYVRGELERVIDDVRIFPFSAKVALESPQDEYFKELKNALTTFFAQEKGNLILVSAIASTLKTLNDVKRSVEIEDRTLLDDLTQLDAKIAELRPKLEEKRKEKVQLIKTIDDKIEEINSYFVSSLQMFSHEFSQKVVDEIKSAEADDLKKYLTGFIESRFREWLEEENKRISTELRTLATDSVEKASEIVQKIEEQFGKIMDIPPTLDLDLTYFSHDVALVLGGLIIMVGSYMFMAPMVALLSTIIGGGGLYIYLRDRRGEKFREESIERTKSAIKDIGEAIKPKIYEQLTTFSDQLKGYVSETIESTITSLESTLSTVRNQKAESEVPVAERREHLKKVRKQLSELEQNLNAIHGKI